MSVSDKPNEPPRAKAWKESEVNVEFEKRAKILLRNAIRQSGLDYEAVATRLGAMGVTIRPAALENKISRGGFSAAFLMQCMEALKANLVSLPR